MEEFYYQTILETSEITLKHNENNFTINYVGIHFNNPQSNKFAASTSRI